MINDDKLKITHKIGSRYVQSVAYFPYPIPRSFQIILSG
jgi:hypothetical protein